MIYEVVIEQALRLEDIFSTEGKLCIRKARTVGSRSRAYLGRTPNKLVKFNETRTSTTTSSLPVPNAKTTWAHDGSCVLGEKKEFSPRKAVIGRFQCP